jgi:uncharacterized membrane protein YeiB
VGYVLTLPGAVMAARPLIGDGRVAAHIYIVWRMGFIGLILAAMFMPQRGFGPMRRWRATVGAVLAAAAGLAVLLVTVGPQIEPHLPAGVSEGRFSRSQMLAGWAALGVGVTALAALCVTRSASGCRWRS